MSNEERQRTIRRAGSQPAEAEQQESARESREELRRQEAERRSEEGGSDEEATPMSEVPGEPPRPRR